MVGVALRWGIGVALLVGAAISILGACDDHLAQQVTREGAVILGVVTGLLYGLLAGIVAFALAVVVQLALRGFRARRGERPE